MRRIPERDRWYVGLIWLAVCGFGADWSGLHYMVGAFLAGAVHGRANGSTRARWTAAPPRAAGDDAGVLPHHRPAHQLGVGRRGRVRRPPAVLLVASVSGKLAGTHLAGRILKWQPGEASLIGWLLQTKALIMIIFANVLLDKHIITTRPSPRCC